MIRLRFPAILAAVSIACGAAWAADYSDPEWPCVQRRADSLSLGLMWPYPVPEGALRPEIAPEAEELIGALVLRRVSLDEARALIAEFAAAHPDLTRDDLGQVFRGVFEQIDRQRSAIIKGIGRYSLKQIDLAARIDATRTEMDAALAAADPDYDRIDALEEQLHWDERIYHDRAQSLTYVCETPVLIEQRAYAIAQDLLAYAPE